MTSLRNLTVPETVCYSLQPEHHMQELMKHVGLFGHGIYCTNVNYFVAMSVVLKWMPGALLFRSQTTSLAQYVSTGLSQRSGATAVEHNCQHFRGCTKVCCSF